MKKAIAILLAVIMTCGLLAGCGSSGNTANTGKTDTPANSDKTFDLKIATFVMETETNGKVMQYFIDQVQEKSGGKVKITPYYGESFAAHNELPSLLASGGLDMAMFAPNIFVSEMPLNSIVTYNYSDGYSREEILAAAQKLIFEDEEAKAALAAEEQKLNIKFLSPQILGGLGVITKKEINSLEDMKGMKITSEGGLDTVWSGLGLVPVMVNVPDLYESFSRNVVEIVNLLTVPIAAMKLYEIGKCYREWTNYYMVGLPIEVNMDVWNSLPSDLQEIFIQASKDAATYSAKLNEEATTAAWKDMEAAGVSTGYLSAEDTSKYLQGTKTVTVDNVWLEYTKTQGFEKEGQLLLEKWTKLITKG